MNEKYNLLFKFELKKLFSQTSTKIISIIYFLFPIIIVLGIVSPNPHFSISMAEFGSAADFSNAIIGFLNSLGFCYIVLVMLSSSTFSKEIESKYIYFVLSAVPNLKKLILYKISAITLVFMGMVTISSITSYIAYSLLYLKKLTFSINDLGILLWGLGISLLITIIYNIILAIINLKTDGNIFISIITSVITVVISIIFAAVKEFLYYLPQWATDYMSNRNNILLVVIYIAITICMNFILSIYLKNRGKLWLMTSYIY